MTRHATPSANAHRDRSALIRRGLLALLALAAGGCFAAAGWSAASHRQAGTGCGALGAVLLAIAGGVWIRLAARLWRDARHAATFDQHRLAWWLRVVVVGLAVAYAVSLAVGPRPGVASLFAALFALWTAVWSCVLSAGSSAPLRALSGRRGQQAARLVYRLVVIAAALEMALQLTDRWPARVGLADAQPQSAAGVLSAPPFDAGRPLDRSTMAARSAADDVLRLALLGCEPGVAVALERRMRAESLGRPLEVVARPNGACDWSDELDAQLAHGRPSLVLALIAIDRDLTTNTESASPFDFRQLRSVRLWDRLWTVPAANPSARSVADASGEAESSHEAFLGECGRRLAAWRTPLDPAMQPAWSELESHLDRLVARCRAERLPLALVVSPSPLQINRVLAETVLRRSGLDGAAVDWELPERRLAAFAQGRRVPLVDLLPALRRCEAAPHVRHSAALSESGRDVAAQSIGLWLRVQESASLAASGK